MSEITGEDLLAAADAVMKAGRASTPVLREALGIGYTRANTLLGELERHDIVGPSDGVHVRKLLVPDWETWEELRLDYFDLERRRADPDGNDVGAHTQVDDEDLDEDSDHEARQRDVAPQRTFVTVHAGQLARVLAEAAKFTDLSEDSEPRCWIELSVSGGWLHAMAFNGVAAGWSRAPLFDPDELPTHYVHNGGASAQLASAMIHADDAKALARVVKHRGEANEFDRATLIFDPDAGTVYVERIEVEAQRDVRITLTDYRGTTLPQDASGDPMGWMRVDRFAALFRPDDTPIGALRIHPKILALFSGLIDPWNDGVRFTFGRQRSNHGGRPLLVRIASTFTGYVLSLDPNIEGATSPESSYRPFDLVDPAEEHYVRPEVEA